jgi:hypothetical protein
MTKRSRAAEPEDGRGNLIRPAEAADWLIPHYFLHGVGLLLQHFRYHGRVDSSRIHRYLPFLYAPRVGAVKLGRI